MERFDASRPGGPTAQVLRQQEVNSDERTPQAYLCCFDTPMGPRIYCLHFREEITSICN